MNTQNIKKSWNILLAVHLCDSKKINGEYRTVKPYSPFLISLDQHGCHAVFNTKYIRPRRLLFQNELNALGGYFFARKYGWDIGRVWRYMYCRRSSLRFFKRDILFFGIKYLSLVEFL